MIVTRRTMSRRTALRGLGATVALPLLDAMVPAMTALAQTPAKAVRRLAVVYHPNGVVYENWVPKGIGADRRVLVKQIRQGRIGCWRFHHTGPIA